MRRMRWGIVALGCLLLLAPQAGAEVPAEFLLRVDLKGGSVADLIPRIDVLADLGDCAIAKGAASDIENLYRAGLPSEILDTNPAVKEYYLVYARPGRDLGGITALADILVLEANVALARMGQDNALQIAGQGFQIARLFMDPMKPVADVSLVSRRILTVYPPIAEMVDAVSTANLETIAADLVAAGGYGTRKSNTAGGHWAGQYIYDAFVSYGIAEVSFHDFDQNADNVVAVIPGTVFPENIFVLGGHYDSISTFSSLAPGADDNASGTAAVLEAARILSQYEFENTVVFIAFASEEFGLYGSNAWARDAYNRGDNILGMLNVDMIGYLAPGDVMDVDIIAGSGSVGLRDLAFWATETYVPGFPAIPGAGVIGGSSDHASFTRYGYRAIWFYEDVQKSSPYIHTVNDTIGLSLNSFELATNCTQSIVATLASLAEPVDAVAIGHTPLGNTANTSRSYPVTARVFSYEPLAAGFPLLHYAINGGTYIELVMGPTGDPDEYRASIPAQALNTTVAYYIEAEDVLGYNDTSPSAAPDAVYTFTVSQSASGWLAAEMTSATVRPEERALSIGLGYALIGLLSAVVLLGLRRKGR